MNTKPPPRRNIQPQDPREHGRVFLKEIPARVRHQLPKLTNDQADVVAQMIRHAFVIGQWLEFVDQLERQGQEIATRSRKGVEGRRRKSKRDAIVAAFNAAAKTKMEVSIEQLAKEYGVSRATAYRALGGKPPTKSTAKRRK